VGHAVKHADGAHSLVMKKILFFSLLMGLSSLLPAQVFDYIDSTELAHTRERRPLKKEIILKTNPGSIFIGHFFPLCSEYKLVAEAVVAQRGGLHTGVSYYAMSPWMRNVIDKDSNMQLQQIKATDFVMRGIRFQLGYRFYLTDPTADERTPAVAPQGFYLMPHYSYSVIEFKYKGGGYREIFYLQNITVNFGLQFILFEQFVFDVYLGGGYKRNTVYTDQSGRLVQNTTYAEEVPLLFENPLKLNAGFMIGWRL
jgi:hypothetical protein